MSSLKRVSPLDPETNQVIMKRLNYSQIADFMVKHPAGVFVEEMDRKAAYWARKRLENLTGKKIQSEPVITKDRREGYSFRFADGQKV